MFACRESRRYIETHIKEAKPTHCIAALPFVYSNLNKIWQIKTDVTGIVARKLEGSDKGISNRFIHSDKCGPEGRGRPLEFVISKSCCFYLDHV
jgi:hypothetical protein